MPTSRSPSAAPTRFVPKSSPRMRPMGRVSREGVKDAKGISGAILLHASASDPLPSKGGAEAGPVQPLDQGLELVELVLPGHQGGAAGLDDDQVVDAQGRDQAAVVGDDDAAPGLDRPARRGG